MDPLDMDRFPHGWELDMERCALAGSRADINFSGMLFDDAIGDGQAQAGAATGGFRREKRIEDAMYMFARNAGSGVGDFDFDAAIVRGGANFQHAAAGHGVAGAEKKIEEDL